MRNNRVIKKIMYYINVQFVSPVSVSSGEEQFTDGDVLRDYDGAPFISGATIAGAMRSYLQFDKKADCIFGNSDELLGKMSSVLISDLEFTNQIRLVTRDGVRLSEGKVAVTGAKYDMEAIDTGAKGHFVLELVVRSTDAEDEMKQQLYHVFAGMDQGTIRFGNKKTRGYGELKILDIHTCEYTAENILCYVDAYSGQIWERIVAGDLHTGEADQLSPLNYTEEPIWKEWNSKSQNQYFRIEVPLKLTGGISIRQYSAKKGEPDFVHTSILKNPDKQEEGTVAVIPGSSFAGAIRSRMLTFLNALPLEKKEIERMMDHVWGYVNGRSACRSKIVIGESQIAGAKPLTISRTGISRFEASARNHALRTERIYVGGTTTLKIDVSKDVEPWILGVLLYVIEDLKKGYLPVGGQTSVGRGIFAANGQTTIDGIEVEENSTYYQAVRTKVWEVE